MQPETIHFEPQVGESCLPAMYLDLIQVQPVVGILSSDSDVTSTDYSGALMVSHSRLTTSGVSTLSRSFSTTAVRNSDLCVAESTKDTSCDRIESQFKITQIQQVKLAMRLCCMWPNSERLCAGLMLFHCLLGWVLKVKLELSAYGSFPIYIL